MSLVLDEHRQYLADPVRLDAFGKAIEAVVRPGDTVLDLGAGTGILGLLACGAGASRVYSVDDGGMIEVARGLARANGLADRMVFIRELSLHARLPERVDVVVADQIGRFGFEAGILEYFFDARKRFLKPDGTMIPAAIDLHVAPVESPEMWQRVAFWDEKPAGLDIRPARMVAVNTGYPATFRPGQMLGTPADAVTLDLASAGPEAFAFETTVTAEREGTLHGIGGWFRARLSPGVFLSNSPLDEAPINRRAVFFPIDRPVRLDPGDVVRVRLRVLPADTIVTWDVSVRGAPGGPTGADGPDKGRFSHSTWQGMLLSQEDLRRSDPLWRPTLTPRGRARMSVLELCDGGRPLEEVEREVHRRHPDLFDSPRAAAVFMAEVVTRYAE
jgi:protein arginine N-methyltransferase 1